MKFITVKSKQTTASVDLVPPLVLGDKQRISLVDIRIPEQYFEFTDDQAIGDENRFKKKLKIIKLSKHQGKYNARRLQQVLNGDSLKAELGLEITITDKAAYLTTQSKEIIVSSELTKNFNIPRESKPYSAVKISGDEKYFVYCDLVEENNSFMSRENNSARVMPSKLLAVAPKSLNLNIFGNQVIYLFRRKKITPAFSIFLTKIQRISRIYCRRRAKLKGEEL